MWPPIDAARRARKAFTPVLGSKIRLKASFVLVANMWGPGGSQRFMREVVRRAPAGLDITILQPPGPESAYSREGSPSTGPRVIEASMAGVSGPLPRRIYRLFVSRDVIRSIDALRRSGVAEELARSDIVYLFNNLYARLLDGAGDLPVIASAHASLSGLRAASNPIQAAYDLLVRRTYMRSVNGLHVFPKFRGALSHPWLRYRMVLPNGVDAGSFRPRRSSAGGKLRLLFISHLEYGKGLDVLLPLLDGLQGVGGYEFHIAGSGSLEGEVRRRRNAIYHGPVSDEELARLYGESDVLVYPSRLDTYSLVVLEALSSGLHVLASDHLRGNFDDFERLGYLEYLPRSVEAFRRRLMDLVREGPQERDREAQHRYVEANYDWKVIAARFYGCLEKFVDAHARGERASCDWEPATPVESPASSPSG